MNRKTKYFRPYEKINGILKPRLKISDKGFAGVYLIKRGKEIIYVGSSSRQLKSTIYRHFQQWTDRQREGNKQFDRVTYPKNSSDIFIRIFICSAQTAARAEKYFIKKFKPRDNVIKYSALTKEEETQIKTAGEELQQATEVLEDAPF